MRKIVLAACLMLPLVMQAQEFEYVVAGKAGKLNTPAKVYLLTQNGRTVQDSSALKNGVFGFKGKSGEPKKVMLLLDKKGVGIAALRKEMNADRVEVYLEKGQIDVSTADLLKNATVKGGTLNADFQLYKKQTAAANDSMSAVMSDYSKATKEQRDSKEFQDELNKRYDVASEQANKITKEFIQSHPASFVSFDLIKNISDFYMDVDVVEPLFLGLAADIRNSSSGTEYALSIEKNKKIAIGAIAPEFSQADVNGKIVHLSDFKGKYVLIDFWASWCGPCRRENPNVVQAYATYKDKNFTVLGVSLDGEKNKDAWLKAIEKDQLTWTQVSDLKGWENEVARLYLVRSIPQNFLLDPQGKIIAKNLRGEALEAKLKEILN